VRCNRVVVAVSVAPGFSLAFFPAYLFIQTGSAKALGSNVVSWSVLGACVLLIALLLYAVKRHVVVIATAYTGGLALMLGVSVFRTSPRLPKCIRPTCA
jgi:hypothetical protein